MHSAVGFITQFKSRPRNAYEVLRSWICVPYFGHL